MWIKEMKLKKGDKITWFIDEKDHNTLKLSKNTDDIEKSSVEGCMCRKV